MAAEWRRYEVSELIEGGKLFVGDGYRAKNDELSSSGLPFARAGNVDGGFRFERADRFPTENLTRVGNKVSEIGDVVFTSKGTVGRLAWVRPDTPRFVYSPQLCFWRSLDHACLDPRFLYYWMSGRDFLVQFKGVAGQTDMAEYVSLSDQRRMYVTAPPVDEQRAIAAILGALDDKIELNRRMSETLEAMARAIFESWFVDVDTDCVTANDLVQAGVLEIGDGYRAKNSELGETGLPFIRAANLNNGFDTDDAECLCQDSARRAGTKISRVGDVAFTSKGTIGRCARVGEHSGPFVYSPQVCYWRSLDHRRVHPAILYCWMQSDDFRSQVQAVAGQTDMAPYVSLRDQRRMVVPRFPDTQLAPGRRIETFLKRQGRASAECRTLAALRAALLPKLVSGELRVAGAERIVGKYV